jgi:hypothetical protein
VLFVVGLAGAIALAPTTTADVSDDVCRMRAAGHDDLDIAHRIQAATPNVDFYNIEQLGDSRIFLRPMDSAPSSRGVADIG